MMAGLPEYKEITKVRVRKDMYLVLAIGEFGRIVARLKTENAMKTNIDAHVPGFGPRRNRRIKEIAASV